MAHREVFGGFEDAGDGQTRCGGIVERGGRRAAGEALDVNAPAQVEFVELFGGHLERESGTCVCVDCRPRLSTCTGTVLKDLSSLKVFVQPPRTTCDAV